MYKQAQTFYKSMCMVRIDIQKKEGSLFSPPHVQIRWWTYLWDPKVCVKCIHVIITICEENSNTLKATTGGEY